MRLKKGSAAAKRYMAKLRRMRGKKKISSFKSKTRATKRRVIKSESKKKVRPMARRRRKTTKRTRRRSRKVGLGGLLSQDTLLLGVGAGASGVLGGYVQKYAPQIPNNYAEAAAAAALVMFGGRLHPKLKVVGKGVMIKVIGDFVETNVMPRMLSGQAGASGDDF